MASWRPSDLPGEPVADEPAVTGTGLDHWQLIDAGDVDRSRRRLTFKLTDGSTRSVIIGQAEDSNDMRRRIGDSLEADVRRLIRGGGTVEG